MQHYPFIFSNERKYRLSRHFIFWASWWLFQSFLYSFSALAIDVSYFQRFALAAVDSFFFLVPHIFLAYTLVYWVVPRIVLKGKYVPAFVAVVCLFLATAFISSLIGMYVLHFVRALIFDKRFISPPHINEIRVFNSLLSGLRGAITIGGLAAAIKLMKFWYTKEQRNLHLEKENVTVQLQLLKAQVHPHFLFNTLNNIYAHTHKSSPDAAGMLIGLSDMLRYMLYECNQNLVPLSKELKMLQDYISLEQARYNNCLDINVEIRGEVFNLCIAPLLLLPFVENCFKHGTSQMLEHPWISFSVLVEGQEFKMRLINGKHPQHKKKTITGIGIANVKKRLNLIYAGKHKLQVIETDDTYVVNLFLVLEEISRHQETFSPKVVTAYD
ncbi:MAG TPA: histidine kinase [Flavisolibacter sp.]|nr:histidine kinase [Flavisolibacter sp.]